LVFNSVEILHFSLNGDIFSFILSLVFGDHSLNWDLFFSLYGFIFHVGFFIRNLLESGLSLDGLSQLSSGNLSGGKILDGKGALANEILLIPKKFLLSVNYIVL
jgi:hypothetical protein